MATILQKLDYVRGKLSVIPAFGDGIGRQVSKAELAICARNVADVRADCDAMLHALRHFVSTIETLSGEQREALPNGMRARLNS